MQGKGRGEQELNEERWGGGERKMRVGPAVKGAAG